VISWDDYREIEITTRGGGDDVYVTIKGPARVVKRIVRRIWAPDEDDPINGLKSDDKA